MFCTVTSADSIVALVARVGMKVAMAGHHVSMVLRSRPVSGIAPQAYWLDTARSRGASATAAGRQTARLLLHAQGPDLADRVIGVQERRLKGTTSA